MLNTILIKNPKLTKLKDLTPIAYFATFSQKSQKKPFQPGDYKVKSTLNKTIIEATTKNAHTTSIESKASAQSLELLSAGTLPFAEKSVRGTSLFAIANKFLQLQKNLDQRCKVKQSLLDIACYKSKAHFIKKLLILIKLKKILSQSLTINTRHIDEMVAKMFSQNCKTPVQSNGQNLKSENLDKLQINLLDSPEPIPRQGLKPFSTVTGFKKLMYNFVKLSQSQLQPGYNRRKYSHSHYNQTLKEGTRLSRIYAYLPKNLIKNLCGFAINHALVSTDDQGIHTLFANQKQSLVHAKTSDKPNLNLLPLTPFSPAYFLRSTLQRRPLVGKKKGQGDKLLSTKKNGRAKKANNAMSFHRPIPKMVNYLESRLDVILWRNQLVSSIRSARQKLQQGIRVNKGLQKTASYQTLPGDVFTFNK